MTNSERIDHFLTGRDPKIILIFIKNYEGESHCGLIPSLSSLSRLVSSGISKSKRARFICTNCHTCTFGLPTRLKNHQELWFKNEPQLITVPPKDTTIKFKNFKNIVKCPIKIVADFECYQPECLCECRRRHKDEHLKHCIPNGECNFGHKSDCEKKLRDGQGPSTEYTCNHKPSVHGFCVVSEHEEVYKTHYESHTFDGDVAKDFIKKLIEVRDKIDAIPSKEMIFTFRDEVNYHTAKKC